MISKFEISNFKSINKLEISLKRFTLLTGVNSSGKSSVIQGLLLISQNLDSSYGLNGPLVTLGDYREIRNYNISSDKSTFSVFSGEQTLQLQISEACNGSFDNIPAELKNLLGFHHNHFHYLSCNRIGSQDIYPKNRTINVGVGTNGEYAIDYLSSHKTIPVPTDLIKYDSDYTLSAQVNYWLRYIVNANIRTEEVGGTDVIKASYSMVNGKFSRPYNVGSGISYLISIIVMCLSSEIDDIMVIENPEIHLHPLSQSRLCEFLYFIANANRQIIVETHSDHIFNALRVGIAQRTMEKENISINFLNLGSDNCTRNHQIEIGRYGAIENPIPNLFDQFQLDLDKMLGI